MVYVVSKRVLNSAYSVKKCLLDSLSVLYEVTLRVQSEAFHVHERVLQRLAAGGWQEGSSVSAQI